jgi:hypothetical protein
METSDVRKRVKEALERVKRMHAERRRRTAQAGAAFEVFRERSVIPVFQQIAGALKAEGYPFTVNTPAGSVRLVSEKSANDYVDLRLDTTVAVPAVMLETQSVRGREVRKEERPIKPGTLVEHLTEQDVLDAVVETLETLIDR